MRRVVITGRGCISGLGTSASDLENALRSGTSGLIPYTDPYGPLIMKTGAPVKGYTSTDFFDLRRLRQLDYFSQFALVAAREAMTQSGLTGSDRVACIIGSGMGGQGTIDDVCRDVYKDGKNPPPFTVPRAMVSAAASQVSMEHGLRGPTFAVSSACATATHAIGIAFHMVRSGAVDAAVTGGSEHCFTYGHLKAWDALRVVSTDTCRPFSKDRSGLILGEGAGVIVLEELEHAQQRGATILAEMIGFGQSADAGDITQPAVDGMAASISGAIADAGLRPEDVDYINAHGTGTKINDAAEAKAMRAVFGEHASKVAISSTKACHGHALGATGAFEAIAAIYTLREGYIPPTLNMTEVEPECGDLDVVGVEGRSAPVSVALSSSFGFGGVNAVIAFRKWTE